jgi:hypothetical protein
MYFGGRVLFGRLCGIVVRDPEIRARLPALPNFLRSNGHRNLVYSVSWVQSRSYLEEIVATSI